MTAGQPIPRRQSPFRRAGVPLAPRISARAQALLRLGGCYGWSVPIGWVLRLAQKWCKRMAGALHEASKRGHVDELRELLAQASPGDVNAGEPKHGYRPLHYGARLPARERRQAERRLPNAASRQ